MTLETLVQLEGCAVHVATRPYEDGGSFQSVCNRYLLRGDRSTHMDECASPASPHNLHEWAIDVQSCARAVQRQIAWERERQ